LSLEECLIKTNLEIDHYCAVLKSSAHSKVDIIYNTTLLCPWDCAVCCVDAVQVKKVGSEVVLRSNGLASERTFPINKSYKNIYEQASAIQIQQGKALSLADKRRIIDHLEGYDAKIDISGGDAMILSDNLKLLHYASKKLGRENVTLTATGIAKIDINEVAPYIGEFNFTFDAESLEDVTNRPDGYAIGNLKQAKNFVQAGCSTRAELPLTKSILTERHLARIYQALHDAKISKLLLMRLFPVGRGKLLKSEIPSKEEYLFAINMLREQEKIYGEKPVLKIQCALKNLENEHLRSPKIKNPCDLVRESFGLMPDGTLLASPWAYSLDGKAMNDQWVLGNLKDEPLSVILRKEKALTYFGRLEENFGHCKIFSYLYSKKERYIDRVFDKADPLYT
jgi:MoaA/NifB/PqqE/SkfB family radical SAM enzyme